jgi:hypothetical protein
MTNITQLIERLRKWSEPSKTHITSEAADALEAQASEIAELREALKPATEIVGVLDRHLSDDWVPVETWKVEALSKALAKLEGSGA